MTHSFVINMGEHCELRLFSMSGDAVAGIASVANYGKPASTIYQLYVDPVARGKGIGTELVKTAFRLIGDVGGKALSGIVTHDGPLEWWLKRGFVIVHCEGQSVVVSKQVLPRTI